MCAQGASAGGGGIGYALTWFGAYSYLDKAVFESSPVFSDIEQGCEVPNTSSVSMCPSTQYGCNGWGTLNALPTETAEYTDHATAVEGWTGGTAYTGTATCANGLGNTTTYNNQWLSQSIVFPAPGGGTGPTFSYPSTAMTGWLCEGYDQEGTLNNSGSQAEIYFQQFTSTSQFNWLEVDGMTNCKDTEGVTYGTPPPSWVSLLNSHSISPTGANAIAFEMSNQLYAQSCHKLHH